MDMEMIKSNYPNPQIPRAGNINGYCVGGAVTRTAGVLTSWPIENELASALSIHNPKLPSALALELAGEIICTNDAGHFDVAWGHVERALQYPNLEPQK